MRAADATSSAPCMASSIARVHTAARSIGLARGALEDSIAYAQQRVQFGRPIGDFQEIRFKIARHGHARSRPRAS